MFVELLATLPIVVLCGGGGENDGREVAGDEARLLADSVAVDLPVEFEG